MCYCKYDGSMQTIHMPHCEAKDCGYIAAFIIDGHAWCVDHMPLNLLKRTVLDAENNHLVVYCGCQNTEEPKEPVFTMAQVKAAFWSNFHVVGEIFFTYLLSDQENEACTAQQWELFLNCLEKERRL